MIRSMTGFGRAEQIIGSMDISVEVKSVNHRYFEFSSRIPRSYPFLDEKLKSFFKDRVARGKLEVSVTVVCEDGDDVNITINHGYADSYVKALQSLSEKYGLKDDVTVSTVARNPDVFVIKKSETDEQYITESVLAVAQKAVDAFVAMREREGEKLVADVNSRIDSILENVEFIELRSPETEKQYRERLEQKIKDLLGDVQIDEQRLITETAIFADKIAVAEETVRLRSHMSQLHTLISGEEAVGRKLDFIVQEMNREANTIGSKAQDIEIAHRVVDIKAEIEKIREQIQNIE